MPLVFDRLTVSRSTNRSRTGEGFLKIKESRLARTGIVEYRAKELGLKDRDPLAIVRVYRPPELFAPEVLASAEDKPLSNSHPGGGALPVTPDNAKSESVGHVRNIRMVGDHMVGDIIVMDGRAISDIESGEKEELSLGQQIGFEVQPGTTPDGQSYDVIQTSMSVNHVALVSKGRCGSSCRVADSASHQTEGTDMPDNVTVQHEGVSYELLPQNAELFKKVRAELQAARAEKTTLVTDHASVIDAKDAEIDKLKGKLEVAEAAVATPEKIEVLAAERAALAGQAKVLVGDSADFTGKTNEQIRREAVEAKVGKALPDHSDDRIAGMFEAFAADAAGKSAYERLGETMHVGDGADETGEPVVSSRPVSEVDKARKAKLEQNREHNAKMRGIA